MHGLTAWRDAAVAGRLPAAGQSGRWQPLRAGVVNLWEYDAAEVWYADGRLQLQGANESGKSTLMTLTTLLLLAGDTSSHNIDTLGQSDKRFRYYVEPTGHALDRRDAAQQKNRGWAWLEFGRADGEYFTLLLFSEARRADGNLKVTWCTAHGPRVRDGLTLASAGLVSEPGQMKDAPGFIAHKSGTGYRDEIARTLYQAAPFWLDQVIRILRVVRTPQIGNRLDLKFLAEAFRIALPPIAEDEINQLADGWEQLQRLRDERDTTERALAAVTEFSQRRWRPWADAVIRAVADPVAAAASKLTQITREERTATEAVDTITAEAGALTGLIRQSADEQRTTAASIEALEGSRAYDDARSAAASARQLGEASVKAEDVARRTAARAADAEARVAPAEIQLAKARTQLDSAQRSVVSAADKVARDAGAAGLVDVTAQYLADRDTARLRQAAALHRGSAIRARELIEEQAEALRVSDAAALSAATARRRAAAAARDAAQRQADAEHAITAVGELLAAWAAELEPRVEPAAEQVEAWTRLVAELTDAATPAPVLAAAIARDHLNPARRPLDRRHAAIEAELAGNATATDLAEAELAAVQAERDPSPRDPEFWSRRARPDRVTAAGAPLWRLVETVGAGPSGGAAELEAALDAAGLLQAWVTADGAYRRDRDGSETVLLATGPGTGGPGGLSLRAVLRPADDAGDLAQVVDRLLASVSYRPDRAAAEPVAPDAIAVAADGMTIATDAIAIGADGRWRHGRLSGFAAPAADGPRLLGAAARAADRARRIGLLRDTLASLTTTRDALTEELADVAGLLSALDAATETVPRDTLVVSAVLTARRAATLAAEAAAEADQADAAERAARLAADDAAARTAAHCAEHALPRSRDDIEEVLGALGDYRAALDGLDTAISMLAPLREASERAAEVLSGYLEASAQAETDAEADRNEAHGARAKADAARAALSKEGQQILTEVGALRLRLSDLGRTLQKMSADQNTLTAGRMVAENTLAQVAMRREEAEAERQAAADRWFGCVDVGLPRLRGVPEPAARHVTAALESARAARSVISIRDWPDDQAAMARRVQNTWAHMVEQAAILRSALETLAGRTVRVSYPGEGDDDFPGGIEVVVDGTGAALPPPEAASRLSALLLRLEGEYDEELTRTINELLGSTFIEHLRDRLGDAERLRSDINAKLAQNPTSVSGITLRLQRMPASGQAAANDVLAALERDFSMLSEAAQDSIRRFLADRVSTAQEEARASGDPDWRSRLAQILDYRRWFELRLEYRTPQSAAGGSAWRTLDRGDHGLLSGGAKVVTLLQPFIAALHAMYDQAPAGPRMIWLDEAFIGVDTANKAAMFRLLTSCDLDWLIAGPGIIVNSASVPLASVYEVRRAPQPLPGVSLELMLWTGNEVTHIMTPDPADLPDLRAGPAAAADDLFSVLGSDP